MKNLSFNWSSAIEKISVKVSRKNFHPIGPIYGNDIKWSPAFKYPHCQSIDLTDYTDTKNISPLMLWVMFNESYVKDMSLSMFIEESNMASLRNIDSNKEMFIGSPLALIIKNMTEHIQYEILLSLSQTIYSELDPKAECVDYPNGKFQSFGDCDMFSIQQELKKDYENLIPFWATKNLTSVTSLR